MAGRKGGEAAQRKTDGGGGKEDGSGKGEEGKMAIWPPPEWEGRRLWGVRDENCGEELVGRN